MDAAVADFEGVLGRCGAHVALPVPVALHASVRAVEHHVVAEVELAFFVEEWSLDVLLEDVGFEGAVGVLLLSFQDVFDLVQLQADDYAVAAVGVLPWLHYPRVELVYAVFVVFGGLVERVEVLQEFEVLVVFESVLDVEGQREVLEDVLVERTVVLVHGLEEGFLVADDEVVGEVVVDLDLCSDFGDVGLG